MQETWVQSLSWEDPLEKGNYPLQYSGLENSMDCIVPGVTKSQTQLNDFHTFRWLTSNTEIQEMGVQFLGQEDPLEKEMTTHSSILAWRIPWTEEPGG